MRDLEKFFLWIIKIGLWVIPFLPLYVSSSMLFPFITGKNFTFRIIVEIIFALWAALAIYRPEYRPRLTPLFKAVTVFVAIVFLADLLGPNPYRSFFSNYERMEGFMMISHLYLYFVILTGVFKTKKDWMVFFHATLAASIAVSYVALTQKFGYRISLQGGSRVDSTIGNPAYLAAYLMFHVWLLFILMHEFWRVRWSRFAYAAILLFELVIIYFTATRGAILALLIGFVLFLAALLFLWPRIFPAGLRWRKWAAICLILGITIPALFWAFRETDFISTNSTLARLTSISLTEKTVQSRVDIWKMSFRAFLERPILGWGQENYYLVFQKYFDPGLHSQEPWFDRSHNIIFDWLIHAGVLGLAGYLSILGAALWMIYRSVALKRIPTLPALALAMLFVSNFLQDLFVFDNLNSYILFFAFLAFVQLFYPAASDALPKIGRTKNNLSAVPVWALVLLFLGGAGAWGYFFDLKPIRQSKELIRALTASQSRPMDEITSAFQKSLSYNSFGTSEAREQMSNFARGALDSDRFSEEEKKRFAKLTVEELRKETGREAKDVKHLLFLASVLTRALKFDSAYAAEAENVLNDALRLSPGKQIVYFEAAQLYLSIGNSNKAIELLKQAWDLDHGYAGAAANLWAIATLAKRQDIISAVRKEVRIDQLEGDFLYRIAVASQGAENFPQALEIYSELVKRSPGNSNYLATHAALLALFGRKDEARASAEAALRIDPGLEGEVREFLRRLDER